MTSCYCRQGNLPASLALLGTGGFPSHWHLSLSSLLSWPPDQSQWLGAEGDQCSLGATSGPEADSLAFSHQLERKAKLTKAVKTLGLPGAKARVKPGQVCSVAGWGQVARGIQTSTLQEAKLRVQDDVACEFPFPSGYYHRASQICVGNPRDMKTSFKVRFPALGRGTQGGLGRGEAMLSCLSLSARAPDL